MSSSLHLWWIAYLKARRWSQPMLLHHFYTFKTLKPWSRLYSSRFRSFVSGVGFCRRGLYKHEKRLIMPLLASSSLLFYCGVAFAYFTLYSRWYLAFTAISIGDDSQPTYRVTLILYSRCSLPLVLLLKCQSRLSCCVGRSCSDAELAEKRPYIVVGAFIVGMMLTPPDMISRALLAIPMCILFEIGLFFARFYVRKPDADEEEETES